MHAYLKWSHIMSIRRFTLVPLALLALALAACDGDPTTTTLRSAAVQSDPSAAATLEWQEVARNMVSANRLSPLATGRIHAALSLAQYRAASAIDEPDAASHSNAGGRALYEARRGA